MRNRKQTKRTLGDCADPFYIWERCPHIERLVSEGKSITHNTAKINRGLLEKYILPSTIAGENISDIRRADVLDFRSGLAKTGVGAASINKITGILKTILKEAYFREDIDRDPTAGIGKVKELKKEKGIIIIDQAWKGRDGELGLPKWEKERITVGPEKLFNALEELQEESIRVSPEDLIFCYDDGSPLGFTWWTRRFRKAMESAGIEYRERNISPHSFRHTLNSLLRGSGADTAKLRATFGWADEDIQDNYTHWCEEDFKG